MPRTSQTRSFSTPKLDAIGEQAAPVRRVEFKLPSYRLHRPSGQAVVTLAGRDHYLGPYGTPVSRTEYQRRLAEWLAAGSPKVTAPRQATDLTVSELLLSYWRYAKTYYKSQTLDGTIAPTIRRLRRLYGATRVSDFGPLALKAFRQSLIDERDDRGDRLSRSYINKAVQWTRRFIRWGVSEQMVLPTVLQALESVEGLKFGRTEAPETTPVTCVADAIVESTCLHLTPVVADMVHIQRLTGMRPGEVCIMTTGELDTSGPVWQFAPRHHKTAHHGKSRVIQIGPKAQVILKPYLRKDLAEPLFSPRDADRQRRENLRLTNVTPFTPSRQERDAARARRPKRVLNAGYTVTNYAQAIRRACVAAGVPHWTPNQLRHTKATELRKAFGLDVAGAVLGHAKLETTQIYAERSQEVAVQAALRLG